MTILCSNRKAHHEYEILDTLECGVLLAGTEVKSLKNHRASLDGAYAMVESNELWMINSHIDEYKNSNTLSRHEPLRRRKLLVHRNEIKKFAEKSMQKGFTLIPLTFYLSNGNIKVQLAVAKGKQLHDKRNSEKDKDAARDLKDSV